jgi:hypothetical protein
LTAAFIVSLSGLSFAQSVNISAPANGSTVASPVHIVASANGGGSPVAAMRLYVDNQPITSIGTSSMNTSANLSAGSHYVVVVGWNTTGLSFTRAINIKVGAASPSPAPTPRTRPGTSAGVHISSPTATSGSAVHFLASATPASGRSIIAMAVYLDNQLAYKSNAASVNTSVNARAGVHNAVVQSWDNTGAVSKAAVQVTVASGTTSMPPTPTKPSSTPATTPTTTLPYSTAFASDFSATSNWMATQFSHTGALMYSTLRINPYYSNLAAIGLVKDHTRLTQVEGWMRWYIGHLNRTDRWGLGGTMYDYNIVNGQEVSAGDADSTDSYAATFLSLAYAYYATGNPAAQSYVRSIAGQINTIAQVLAKTQQSDGLTWAKPNYQIKYLMDNAEVFRGLADAATLFGSIGDTAKRNYYSSLATKCQNGVWGMWLGGGKWAVYKDGIGRLIAPSMGRWYPDATSQMFPVLYGVVSGSDGRAQQAYASLNATWPGWPQLSYNRQDPFPWVMIVDAAALVGDKARVTTWANSARAKWVNKGFPWTWYSMEAGWYMRLADYMDGGKFF